MAYALTPARRAASLKNLRLAWEMHRELGYRSGNPKPPLSREARDGPFFYGLYARNLRRSVIHMGEDVHEFDRHLRRFVRAFAPRNPVERTLVRAIGETAWRMLRAYYTRAAADAKMLKHLLNSAPRARALSAGDTLDLIIKLELALGNDLKLMDSAARIRRQLERLTGMLVRKRSRGKLDYRIITKEHKNDWANLLKYARKKKAARSR